jgi:hypothetical protein
MVLNQKLEKEDNFFSTNGRKYIVGWEKINFTCVFWLMLMSLVFLKKL